MKEENNIFFRCFFQYETLMKNFVWYCQVLKIVHFIHFKKQFSNFRDFDEFCQKLNMFVKINYVYLF